MSGRSIFLKPFLKWAGGKRYLLPMINKFKPKKYNNYIEPFLWWWAVLFDLMPKNAFVNDINSELINLYETIRDDVDVLIEHLRRHKNDSVYFYKIRWLDRIPEEFSKLTKVEKASRIIYLNKTCFNWLFRVNSQWQFNSPFWRYKNPNIINEEVLRTVSTFLNQNNIQFFSWTFSSMLTYINEGDFVYLDPPYYPISDTSSFTWYTLDWFWKEDQESLKEFCDLIGKKWAYFLLSNSDTLFIRGLYTDYMQEVIAVPRSISATLSWRDKVNEVLIYNNYKIHG